MSGRYTGQILARHDLTWKMVIPGAVGYLAFGSAQRGVSSREMLD